MVSVVPYRGVAGASCPPPEADKNIWYPFPSSMPLAGSSDPNYSSVFEGLPPSLRPWDAPTPQGQMQPRLPVL